eukprot:688086-Amphidinium_carterae.1
MAFHPSRGDMYAELGTFRFDKDPRRVRAGGRHSATKKKLIKECPTKGDKLRKMLVHAAQSLRGAREVVVVAVRRCGCAL